MNQFAPLTDRPRLYVEMRPVIVGVTDGPLVVTFQSAAMGGGSGGENGLDKTGFGETFLAKAGVNAVHILASHNHWYQTPEIFEVLAEVRQIAAQASRIVTYGSSMGAYAAIRFAPDLGAHAAVALGPQYSVNPAKAPFEKRFARFYREDEWLFDEFDAAAYGGINVLMLYDPLDDDGKHAKLLMSAIPSINPMALPFCGHPVGPVLKQTGLVSSIVKDMAAGTFDADDARSKFIANRRTAPTYLRNLYQYTRRAKNPRRQYLVGRVCFEAGVMVDKIKVDFATKCRAVGDNELAKAALGQVNVANLRDPRTLEIYERECARYA